MWGCGKKVPTWQNGHRLMWPSRSNNTIGSSCGGNYTHQIKKTIGHLHSSTGSWAFLLGSDRSRLRDGHGVSMCQGVLHWEQKENWQEEHTTTWLRWLREIVNMPKNFRFVFFWDTSSVKVHTVSQPGRGHHINLGSTATSEIHRMTWLQQSAYLSEHWKLYQCSVAVSGKVGKHHLAPAALPWM